MEELHRSIFLKELKIAFPQLKDDIKQARSCLMLAEKYCSGGNADLRNAIAVSFVEHLDLRQAQWAWDLLGPHLRDVYLQCVAIGTAPPLPYLSQRKK